ncbi:hypothetical protein CEK64_09875 [Xanthomonas sontii]|uniref:antiviral reverse transcriptase Drt2 n=1 Tax=Xanthomonas sontii TaxID=2650745 RepID=UPI00123E408A|nr:antiviral reverse transcriptase Drt2 [Xanthomonas sontii]KAA8919972.1 hypothetical protein CEK64_09875 [Xanthomonas sontii]
MRKESPKSALEAAQIVRKYVHFDVPLSKSACAKLVADPVAVSRHAFYPFLRHDIIRTKLKRGGSGKIVKSSKIREIRYAAHADAAIYSYYNFLLMEKYERCLEASHLSENVTAFRSLSKSNVDFAKEVFDWIGGQRPCIALGFDVRDFFGTLDHLLLKRSWCSILGMPSLPQDHFAVFKSLTKHASVELIAARKALGITRSRLDKISRLCDSSNFRSIIRGKNLVFVNNSARGIPQGSPISAALSNMYMFEFDNKIKAVVESLGGLYRRYCDDILVVMPDVEDIEHQVSQLIESSLKELNLSIQESKTLICRFDSEGCDVPLQYLGLVYDGKRIFLRPSGVARFYIKMRRGVKQFKCAKRMDGGTALLVQRRRKLINRYTEHTPSRGRSYFKYVKMAAKKTNSDAIRSQLKSSRKRLKALIEK